MSTANAPTDTPRGSRVASLDALRGLIIVLMVLDHVRIFFTNADFDPLDLNRTSVGHFLTRWITHLCAPGFFFVAGVSIALRLRQARSIDISRWLLGRGLLLILLEWFVFSLAWSFSFDWHWLGVIWGLGAAMLAMAVLIHLRARWLLIGAMLFLLLHDGLWPLLRDDLGWSGAVLYRVGVVPTPWHRPVLVLYPLVPWLALMVLGFGCTPWLMPDALARTRLWVAGAALIALFGVTRLLGFGQAPADALTWPDARWKQVLAFLDVEKYPPSLQFSLLTLGLLAGLWAALDTWAVRGSFVRERLSRFGREPLLIYGAHLFLIHGLAWLLAGALNWPADHLIWRGVGPNLTPPAGFGFGLLGVYLVWLVVLILLDPIAGALTRSKRCLTEINMADARRD